MIGGIPRHIDACKQPDRIPAFSPRFTASNPFAEIQTSKKCAASNILNPRSLLPLSRKDQVGVS